MALPYDRQVPLWNRLVIKVLESPGHRLLSKTTDVVRFTGRRSGRTITTPTQYVSTDDGLAIFVGNPSEKTWWRNFTEPRDVDVLVQRHWQAMSGRVVTCDEDPVLAARLLQSYLDKFPRARGIVQLPGSDKPVDTTFVLCVGRD
mgnify:CR=1 FL=1